MLPYRLRVSSIYYTGFTVLIFHLYLDPKLRSYRLKCKLELVIFISGPRSKSSRHWNGIATYPTNTDSKSEKQTFNPYKVLYTKGPVRTLEVKPLSWWMNWNIVLDTSQTLKRVGRSFLRSDGIKEPTTVFNVPQLQSLLLEIRSIVSSIVLEGQVQSRGPRGLLSLVESTFDVYVIQT